MASRGGRVSAGKKPAAKKPAASARKVAKSARPAKSPARAKVAKAAKPAKKPAVVAKPSRKAAAAATKKPAAKKSVVSARVSPVLDHVAKKPGRTLAAGRGVKVADPGKRVADLATGRAAPPSRKTPVAAPSTTRRAAMPPAAPVGPAVGSMPLKDYRHGPIAPPIAAPATRLPPQPVTTDGKPKRNRAGFSTKDLLEFRDALLAKRRELLGDMNHMETEALRSNGSNLSNLPVHMADMGTDNYEQEFTLGLVEKDRSLLREIHSALAKIQDGSYGICEGTGSPISKARLEVQPWARFSIEYARQLERNPYRRMM